MHESDYNIQAISHLRKMINDAELPKKQRKHKCVLQTFEQVLC